VGYVAPREDVALSRYRRRGADLPFANPAGDHAASFEGYYWRFTDESRKRVVIVLAGLSRTEPGRWAVLAMAVHPGGDVRIAKVDGAEGDPAEFGVRADGALSASPYRLRLALAGGEGLEVEITEPHEWSRRSLGASGVAQLIPGLEQYWHPHLLGGRARGEMRFGDARIDLDGASVYAEKNWGPRFPGRWWWGQTDAFEGIDGCVAFAGGPMRVGGLAINATLVVVRLGRRLLALAPPFALTRADVDEGEWRIRARSPRYSVEIQGEDAGSGVALPVPVPGERAFALRSHQALAGRLSLTVRQGRRVLYRGESTLAGLERPRA